MSLRCEFEEWLRYPNSLGSEASIATIIGRVYHEIGEDIPDSIIEALRCLGRRADARDRRDTIRAALKGMAGRNLSDEIEIKIDDVLRGVFSEDAAGDWALSIAIICRNLEEKLRVIEGNI